MILILCINFVLVAQKSDSSVFKLKKINIGFEIGRSPYRLNKTEENINSQTTAKILPYFSFMCGYNLSINKYNYIIPKLGCGFELSNYNLSLNTIESFNGVNTVGTQTVSFIGNKRSNYNYSYKKNSRTILVSAEYLHLSDVFDNDKFLLATNANLSLNYELYSYYKISEVSYKDSIGIIYDEYSSASESKNFNTKNYSNNLFFQFQVGIGILICDKMQQHIYLALASRVNNRDLYTRYGLFRINYCLNF